MVIHEALGTNRAERVRKRKLEHRQQGSEHIHGGG